MTGKTSARDVQMSSIQARAAPAACGRVFPGLLYYTWLDECPGCVGLVATYLQYIVAIKGG